MKSIVFLPIIVVLTLIVVGCSDSASEDLVNGPNNNEKFDLELIGKWERSIKNRYFYDYHFLNNGFGFYEERHVSNKTEGKLRIPFEWQTTGGKLTILEDGNSPETSEYVIKNDILTFGKNNFEYTHVNSLGTVDFDYTQLPYPNGYITNGSYHYKITMVKESCSHGQGTTSNYKFINFFGENGELSPNGFTVSYATPYYEGISSDWPEGVYKLRQSSSYWTYVGFGNVKGVNTNQIEGTLKIKRVGRNVTYDITDGDWFQLHFEGSY